MIKLYDTLTRSAKNLEKSEKFGYYCCGPTVYGPAHIGNFRTFLIQDVLRRLLELCSYHPIHVRNITDVDDKTIRGSRERCMALTDFTDIWTQKFHADCAELGLLAPHYEPRPTQHIAEQITLIESLVKKGHAYVSGDGVYFNIQSFKNYGKLIRLDRRHNETQKTNSAGTCNRADEYDRESACDFALWKLYKPEDGDVFWPSPWGNGRPGWHIECSAMAMRYLGDTVHLHGGGVDLCFPHHENEIAQSEASTGNTFVQHWFHSAHLMVDGAKMSKSLGNLYTLDDIKNKQFSPTVLRYTLLAGHYRQPLNFTIASLYAAQSALLKLGKFLNLFNDMPIHWREQPALPQHWNYLGTAFDALCNDLNIPLALGQVFKTLPKITSANVAEFLTELRVIMYALGLEPLESKHAKTFIVPQHVQSMAQTRWEAKRAKDFERADALRQTLQDAGWQVADNVDDYEIFPSK